MDGNPHFSKNDENLNPTKQHYYPPDTRDWAEVDRLPCGMKVGRQGRMWYVLDENDWAVSEGYKQIYDDGETARRGLAEMTVELYGPPDRGATHPEDPLTTGPFKGYARERISVEDWIQCPYCGSGAEIVENRDGNIAFRCEVCSEEAVATSDRA